jgi:hypothetical protein
MNKGVIKKSKAERFADSLLSVDLFLSQVT